jgi:hypothetical protein
MYPPVLEHLEHEGKSAPNNTRADQRRVPSHSVPYVVLTAVAACSVAVQDRRPVGSAWVKGERNGAISNVGF